MTEPPVFFAAMCMYLPLCGLRRTVLVPASPMHRWWAPRVGHCCIVYLIYGSPAAGLLDTICTICMH